MNLNEEIARIKEVMLLTERLSIQGSSGIVIEQRISDLPQNQGPKAIVSSPQKPKDLTSTLSPQQRQQYKDSQRNRPDLAKIYADAQKPKPQKTYHVEDAINYIKENGIGAIMESLRSALLSIGGVAVQSVLAFTGVGAIANDVAWGILTLYDGYQYFINGSSPSLMNLIIDVICLVTAGTLGSVLGKFAGKVTTSISGGIKTIMESGAGKFIKPVLETIMSGAGIVAKWLGEAATFMSKNMGIQWASKVVGSVKNFFKSIMTAIGEFFGAGAGAVAGYIQRKGVQLLGNYSPTIAKGFALLSAEQIEAWVGRTVTSTQLKAAEKLAEENLQNKPTQEVLNLLDKEFGTHMGDLFALYLNSKKLSSASKGLTVKGAGADVLIGKDPTEKTVNYSEKIKSAGQQLAGNF